MIISLDKKQSERLLDALNELIFRVCRYPGLESDCMYSMKAEDINDTKDCKEKGHYYCPYQEWIELRNEFRRAYKSVYGEQGEPPKVSETEQNKTE